MKNRTYFYFFFVISLCFSCILTEKKSNDYWGEYIGQKPCDSAEIFTPDFVSSGLNERDAAWFPDGSEFYFTVTKVPHSTIFYTWKDKKQQWSALTTAQFSGRYSDLEPFISPAGDKMFFVSNRPSADRGPEPKDFDIYYCKRSGKSWSEAYPVGFPINTDGNEFYPSVAASGNLYFTAERENGKGGEDIYMSKYIDGIYGEPINLGDSINTDGAEFNAFIAADESYLIYNSSGFGNKKANRLRISFKNLENKWLPPVDMGDAVNGTSGFSFCPYVTTDEKFLFFSSNRSSYPEYSKYPVKYGELYDMLHKPGNGSFDIYVVNASIIEKLREQTERSK